MRLETGKTSVEYGYTSLKPKMFSSYKCRFKEKLMWQKGLSEERLGYLARVYGLKIGESLNFSVQTGETTDTETQEASIHKGGSVEW